MKKLIPFLTSIQFLMVLLVAMTSLPVLLQGSEPGIGGVLTSDEKVIWLRAGDLALDDNDPVGLWPDFSQNGNAATQTNSTSQPVYFSNGGSEFNSLPVVRFNGNSHFMEIANNDQLNNMDGLTILFVMRLDGTGTQAFLTKRANHNNQNRFGFLYHQNRIRFDVEAVDQSSNVPLNTTSSFIIGGMFNGNLSGNRQFVFRNGTQVGSRTNSNTHIGTNNEPVRLGRFNDGDDRNLNGDVAEVLMYRTGLNNAQRLIVENVLAIKYGIDIGANQMFSPGGYDQDIIGVGTTDGIQKHSETSGGGGGLYLSERDNGFNEINEFVFAGHSGLGHGISTTGLGNIEDVDERWNRVWRIERRTNGVVDGGNTPVSITFDFEEAGITPSYDNVYVLLHKLNEGDADFTMVPSVYASVAGNRATFNVPDELFKTGYYTIGEFTGDASEFMIKTWTSQITGNWNNPLVWKDQYGNNGTPSTSATKEYDNIVIKNGHTITITDDNYINNDLFITEGGILNIGNTRGHHWGSIRGQGRIRIIGDYFPEGNATQFTSQGGGITEYYGDGTFSFEEDRTFNHLYINLNNLSSTLTLLADLTINGNFHIDRGTFYINDNSSSVSRRIRVEGNVRVASNITNGAHVRLFTGEGNAQHFFTMRGNLTVNALTRFANLTGPSYNNTPGNGYVQTIFNHPTRNQTAQINAVTEFYRIEINKGVDDTYSLLLSASAPDLFFLWGRTDQNQGGTPPNRTNNNSLGLLAGTVIIGDHIEITRLRNAGGQNYDIDQDAQIIVDGGRLLAPLNSTLAIVVYGKLTLKLGYLEAMGTEGVTIREFGTFEVNGGTARTHIIRTSVIAGIHRGAYVQTAGVVDIVGPNGEGTHFRFSLPYPTNSFTMTGGTMNVRRPKNNGSADQGGILIGASKENIMVSGGTVNAIIDFNKNFIINSNAPFFNLNLINENNNAREFFLREYNGGGTVPAQPARPLEVINQLNLHAGTFPARLNLNGQQAIIHKDIVIQDGAQFIGAGSHLKFVGNNNSEFNIESAAAIFSVDTLSLVKEESSHELLLRSDSRVSPTPFLIINNFLKAERGFLNYGFLPLHLLGDVENHDAIGNEFEPGKLILGGSDTQNIFMPINNNTAYFGRMEINNAAGVRLHNNFIPAIHNLILTQGVFDIRTFRVTVTGNITGAFGDEAHIISVGNHSDGGLIRRITGDGIVEFPLGVYMGPNARYAPLTAHYENVTEPVFVQVNTVRQELPTLANDIPDHALRMYWRIRHSDVGNLPDVNSYVFQHPEGMEPDPMPADFVPGKVVNFERSTVVGDIYNEAARTLTFQSGFPLEQGEYTAGHIAKFTGTVNVFYSRVVSDFDNPAPWDVASTWSFDGHNGAADTGGETPQPGDLVQIGFSDPADPESYHVVEVNNMIQVGGIIFYSLPEVELPGLKLAGSFNAAPGNISGEGAVMIFMDTETPALFADMGDFNEGERSRFIYQAAAGNTYTIPAERTVYPNLILQGPGSPTAGFLLPNADLLIKEDFRMENNARALLSNGASGNLTILGDLVTGTTAPASNGELLFRASVNPRKVNIEKDIRLKGDADSGIFAENTASAAEHMLIAKGDIAQSAGNLSLFTTADNTRVILSLQGQNDNVYTRSGGNIPYFYRLVMNKGFNQNHSFTFENDFTLNPDASGPVKPIVLENGVLALNHSGIDVNLNTGNTYDFKIPPASGLILKDASANVNGNVGISLNGLLKLEGTGRLIMTGGDAYIVYGADGQATLEVHDSAELSVGSQIRRPSAYDPAILRYRQTGGTVTVGTHSVTTTNRGVFEVTGNSSFRMTGGELIIARGHGGTEASFLLNPADFLLDDNATIYFGHASAPNNNVLTIRSTRPLPNVVIEGGSGFTARLRSEPLTVNGELQILSGKTFDTNQLDLYLKGDFINKGTFLADGSTVTFNGVSQVKTGVTTFHNLVMDVNNDLHLGEGGDKSFTQITVNGNLELISGTLIDNGYGIDLKGDLVNQAAHFSNETTGGMKFSGTDLQEVSGTGSAGRLEIDNHSGVRLNNALTIQNELLFTNGILDIQGNRLTLGAGSSVTSHNDFSPDKMIKATGLLSAQGVRIFLDGEGEFLVPIGVTGKYTPVKIIADANPATPYLDIVPRNAMHSTIPIDSIENLQYHWIIESFGMANFTGLLQFRYIQPDVEGDETKYYPARLSGEFWAKLGTDRVNDEQNYFVFDYPGLNNNISGDYTAGEKIPDRVLRFRSTGNSTDWTSKEAWENIPPDEEPYVNVPDGGPRGNIIEIQNGHTISIPSDGAVAYRSFIDGTLEIGTTGNHYLGVVDGSGKIVLESAYLPIGRYDSFLAEGKGTLEYSGEVDYTVDPAYLPQDGAINRLIFSGSGEITWPARDMLIYNNLEVRGNTTFNNANDVAITLRGDLVLEEDAGFIAGYADNANITFHGSGQQYIFGQFTGQNALNRVHVDNDQGLRIEGETEIENVLVLMDGRVITSEGGVLRLLNTAQIIGDNFTRYIEGPLQKLGVGSFIFPVGTEERMGRIAFVPDGSLETGTILQAQYFLAASPDYDQVVDPLERVSSLEYWQLESIGSETIPNGKVRLYYEDASFSHITDPGSLLVGRYNGSHWISQGRSDHYAINEYSGFIESENIDDTGLFTFATDNSNFSNNPLPVELLSFTATVQGSEVLVEWVTASETNNNFFTVERSSDGITFETLGYVNGAGTVNEVRHYQLYDSEPFTGISYYRLKQTDFDGSSEYVGLVAVQIRKDVASLMQVYPNPVRNGEVNVRISNMQPDETVTIHIMDLQGRLMRSEKVYADNNGAVLHRLNQLSGLPAGLYFVVLQSRTSRITERIIIQ